MQQVDMSSSIKTLKQGLTKKDNIMQNMANYQVVMLAPAKMRDTSLTAVLTHPLL